MRPANLGAICAKGGDPARGDPHARPPDATPRAPGARQELRPMSWGGRARLTATRFREIIDGNGPDAVAFYAAPARQRGG